MTISGFPPILPGAVESRIHVPDGNGGWVPAGHQANPLEARVRDVEDKLQEIIDDGVPLKGSLGTDAETADSRINITLAASTTETIFSHTSPVVLDSLMIGTITDTPPPSNLGVAVELRDDAGTWNAIGHWSTNAVLVPLALMKDGGDAVFEVVLWESIGWLMRIRHAITAPRGLRLRAQNMHSTDPIELRGTYILRHTA